MKARENWCAGRQYKNGRVVYQYRLAEHLSGRVYCANAKYQMGRSKLPVHVHKDFVSKYEVEIFHMYDSKIWLEHFSFCKKSTERPVSLYVSN